ncbi:MAG: type 1 periplasmic binding fold superfamily protein [Polaribacter sp.]|uniref:type 1 periplasmic binding fold superfamily protein n=1 Tax=Polaribacter sp. TaxID=1920175 RepID=UPI003BB1BFCB
MKTIKLLSVLFITTLTFTACSEDDDHNHGSEEELITTVRYTLTNGNNIVTLTFSDPDGEGGNAGTYTVSGTLSANTTYSGSIQLLNETTSPAEDITEEVKAEADEHEFFYTSNVAGLTITKTDTDSNNNPLGVTTSLTTSAAGAGTFTIILKHEPTKPNNGTSAGAGGSTDVEVTFNITIQ